MSLGFKFQPKGGYKTVKDIPLKNWKVVCPKCSTIEATEADNPGCPNCNGDVQMTYGEIFSQKWKDEDARRSYRKISCKKGCGWQINEVECSKCGASISGDFFKGDAPAFKTNCFVATSAFNSARHETVYSLQEWRDNYLINSKGGRAFIKTYYIVGPFLAIVLDTFSFCKPFVRKGLNAFARKITNQRVGK